MPFQIKLKKSAEKSLNRLDYNTKDRILNFLETRVKPNPMLLREPLQGTKKGLWKYRVGDYRIICEFKNSELVVLVIEIGHRREVYN